MIFGIDVSGPSKEESVLGHGVVQSGRGQHGAVRATKCGEDDESKTWTAIGNNSGYGFFEAWYAEKTDTPALLVEMNNQSDFDYLNKHADAVVTLLEENVVK